MSPLLSSEITLPDRTLWFGRAELYRKQIVLKGWRWNGRFKRDIQLDQVREVEVWMGGKESNFILHLEDGGEEPLRIEDGVGLWHWKLKGLGVQVRAQG